MPLCDPRYRALLAFVVKHDPGARAALRIMRRLGAQNMRADTILFRTPSGTYDQCPDPGAWNATVRGGIHVCMIRRGPGEWSFHS
jgi:hypothetical protein